MSRVEQVNPDDFCGMFNHVFFWSRKTISYPLLAFPVGSNAYTVRRPRRLTWMYPFIYQPALSSNALLSRVYHSRPSLMLLSTFVVSMSPIAVILPLNTRWICKRDHYGSQLRHKPERRRVRSAQLYPHLLFSTAVLPPPPFAPPHSSKV
jgi:hypothetical protein